MQADDEYMAMVVDNGSGMIKIGLAGDENPKAVFPTVIGRPQSYTIPLKGGIYYKDSYIGDEAQSKRNILDMNYPIEHGVITNWEDMEEIWNHMFFSEVRVHPQDHPWLLTEPPNNPKSNREKMTEIFFENYEVPGLYVSIQTLLSVYSSGRLSAAVLDSGDGVTHVMSVYEGHAMPRTIERIDLGGRDLTNNLVTMLADRAYTLTTPAEFEIAWDIKEKNCYVAIDFGEEMANVTLSDNECRYTLPDGQTLTVGNERFRCPEGLFKPSLMGLDYEGFHQMVSNSIMKSEIDSRSELYSNIILSGGSTMFPGMAERMQKEMESLVPSPKKVKVVADPERKNFAWLGGSILASLSQFYDIVIAKQEYDDTGPSIVHKKCF